jgi:hypothetical protein
MVATDGKCSSLLSPPRTHDWMPLTLWFLGPVKHIDGNVAVIKMFGWRCCVAAIEIARDYLLWWSIREVVAPVLAITVWFSWNEVVRKYRERCDSMSLCWAMSAQTW